MYLGIAGYILVPSAFFVVVAANQESWVGLFLSQTARTLTEHISGVAPGGSAR
jgi:hypothetical protein